MERVNRVRMLTGKNIQLFHKLFQIITSSLWKFFSKIRVELMASKIFRMENFDEKNLEKQILEEK